MVSTLELFHLYAEEAGWVLDAQLPGGEHVLLEGRVRSPALPGPSTLELWYVDAPRIVTIDGAHGTLAAGTPRPTLACAALGAGKAHIAGTLALAWTPVGDGEARNYPLAIELDVQLIT